MHSRRHRSRCPRISRSRARILRLPSRSRDEGAARRESTTVRSILGRIVWWPEGREALALGVRGLGFLGIAGLLWLGLDTPLAQAVEYRLQIVSMWESGFTGFVRLGELGDGGSGPRS